MDLPIQPDFASSLSKQPVVRKVKFGDGYEQRSAQGLNNNPEKWALNWEDLTNPECQALLDFFDGLNGVTAFTWICPYAVSAKKYVAEKWDATPVSINSHRLTVSIYQVFTP